MYRPESLVWLEGYQALQRWRDENGITGLYAVPYDVEVEVGATEAFPLGRWVPQQRKALRVGQLDDHRRQLLDEAGMVWEPGEEAWENKLAVLRSYRRVHAHLAPRQDAVWDDTDGRSVAIGQLMANLRRKGGLGKDPERAKTRAEQLRAIAPDWNCPWPLNWQRHYRVLADLVDADGPGILDEIRPGVMVDGDDLGTWLQRQQRDWNLLSAEQRERLARLGLKPAQQPTPTPVGKDAAKKAGKPSAAFQRGIAALAQYIAREGHHRVPRSHAEEIAMEGEGAPVVVKLGVWISNTKSRRDKLTQEQLNALRELGMEWA
ncbi:hypothetical protein GCM10010405_30870 [Streptomyces macrosporus]|uniref:Helicase-associated domain-containing protein n=1 Tax=Streptomyces macrosporus TaxID=44032 RepID=A0ABP5X4S9_9ACTN